jgi:hypothetical protein
MPLGKFQKADEMEVHNPERLIVIEGKEYAIHPMKVKDAVAFMKGFTKIRNAMLLYAGPSVTAEDIAEQFPAAGLKGEELQAQLAKQKEALAAIPKAEDRINDFQAAWLSSDVVGEILPMLPFCIDGIELDDIPMHMIPELVRIWVDQNLNDEILKNWKAVDDQIRSRSIRVSDFVARSHSRELSKD